MTSWEAFQVGLANVFSWPGFLIPVVGTLLAMVASFLPGLGNASIAVLAMVLTLHWEPVSVLLLFGALTGGATFMGSITAILFNIPGSVSSTPALLEGYPLSQRGLTRTAIACAATASAVGSVFGVLVLLALLPIVEPLILKVGPLEILLIGVFGLTTIVAIPSKSQLRGACMAGLGLLFSMVGSEPLQGMPRWSLGSLELSEGIGIVPMMMGIFTISELIEWMRPARALTPPARAATTQKDSVRGGALSVFRHFGLTLRSSAIGVLVGMVPGIGGTVAGFVAYGHAVQSNPKERHTFGQGNIKGLIAPEAAVDAKDGGSLLPTLALGLPGSEACVILLAVFAMHGLVPGIPMMTTHLALTYTLILALLFSNVMTSLVGVWMAPPLARLGSVRIERLALPALLVCLVSAVQLEGRLMDLYVMLFFGVLGYFWRIHAWPRIPFVIAFVLGSLIEKNFALTTQLVSAGRIDLTKSAGAIALVFAVMVAMGWWWVIQARRLATERKPAGGLGLGGLVFCLCMVMLLLAFQDLPVYSPYAWGVVCVTAALAAVVVGVELWGWQRYSAMGHWFMDLRWEPGHGAGLALVSGLLPGVWLLGLGPAVGLGVGFWTAFRLSVQGGVTRAWLVGGLAGGTVGGLVHWVLSDWVNIALSPGLVWDFLGKWIQ